MLERLYKLTLKKKEIEAEIKAINEEILNSDDINLENDHIKVSIIPESSYKTLDMNKVKNKEPDLYKELLDVYSKEVSSTAYVKVKIK
ncbi:MAG: hypothetical protein E7E84_07685 [Peptoniphilus lacydonensis]|uniref:hypothetical protein n=1 Tax=Peptoniphilus lacydonensis TaxID=1673725 RepID=UPI002903226C|nr:hypothetical protein [Peptoniphilus lacydonensis]MDU2116208.1 hypothetical protein [Peptoniphilus lacydonensis]